jgi:hypothetical protein
MKKRSKYKYTYYQNTHTLQNPHIYTPTHYKTHTYTHPHITKPTHIHTHPHITKPTYIHTPTHYKTHTHTHTHTSQNQLEQPQHKIHTKWNSHNTIKYPQYKVILMYRVLLSTRMRLKKAVECNKYNLTNSMESLSLENQRKLAYINWSFCYSSNG